MFFINGVGHGTIQFNDTELEESSFIELQYTGQPKIVLKELELLFHRAVKKNKLTESSWATAEYISLFRKKDDSIEIASDNRRSDIDFEYKVIMDYDEWKIEYEHIDQRGMLDGFVGKKNHIDVDFLNGSIMKEGDYFWEDCGEKKTFIIQKGKIRDISKIESEISDYKQIITQNKTLATVLISGHIDEALKYIEIFGQYNPQFKQTAEKLMMEFYAYIKGDSTKTSDIMARAYSLARKGNNFIQKADYEKALDYFEKALDLCPNDISLLNNIGFTYGEMKKYDKAIETYEKSLKIKPSHANTWNGLALSYKKLGKYEDAIRACKKAIELDPNDKDFQNNFTIIMEEYHLKDPSKRKNNEYKKRFLYIERDLIQGNKFSIAKSELGHIIHEVKIKNLSEVLDRARELLRLCNSKEREFSKMIDKNDLDDLKIPKEAQKLFNLANEYIDNKEFEEALKYLNQALEIEPNYAEVMSELGYVHFKLDYKDMTKEEVFNLSKKAIDLNPKSSIVWRYMGLAYAKKKDFEKAIECYNKCIEIDPNDKAAYRSLAYLYGESGNLQKVIEIFQKLFKVDPDLAEGFIQSLPKEVQQKFTQRNIFTSLEMLERDLKSTEEAYRLFRNAQSEIRESAKKFPNDVFIQKLSKLDLSNFSKIIPEILEKVEDKKQWDLITNFYREFKMRGISSSIPWDMRYKIKDTTINLSVKYNRLQIPEIAEKCGSPQDCVIVVIKEMIKNEEIYADYFESTQFVVFDQKANLDETENIRNKFEAWEKTTCKNCGMKIKETNQKICEHCGLDL